MILKWYTFSTKESRRRSNVVVSFKRNYLRLCFLELVVLTLDKILQVWLMRQLWKFTDMFFIELPKWCQRDFFDLSKIVRFLDLRAWKIAHFSGLSPIKGYIMKTVPYIKNRLWHHLSLCFSNSNQQRQWIYL